MLMNSLGNLYNISPTDGLTRLARVQFRFVSMRIPTDFFSAFASFDRSQKSERETIVIKFVLNVGNKRAKIFYGSKEKGRE